MSNVVYILEMVIESFEGIVNEPLGVYSSEEEAEKWLNESRKTFTSENIIFNIIPMKLDEKPPLLTLSKEFKQDKVGYQLLELYKGGIFNNMIEPDGSFSYQLKDKYKKYLEEMISKNFDELK